MWISVFASGIKWYTMVTKWEEVVNTPTLIIYAYRRIYTLNR